MSKNYKSNVLLLITFSLMHSKCTSFITCNTPAIDYLIDLVLPLCMISICSSNGYRILNVQLVKCPSISVLAQSRIVCISHLMGIMPSNLCIQASIISAVVSIYLCIIGLCLFSQSSPSWWKWRWTLGPAEIPIFHDLCNEDTYSQPSVKLIETVHILQSFMWLLVFYKAYNCNTL